MWCLRAFALLTLIGIVSTAPSAWAASARLALQSEPGDYIGQGGMFDITYTPENSYYFSAQIRRTIGSDPAELLFVLGTPTVGPDNTFASLFFGTDQLGIPIQPGFYPLAERADFASPGHPGLDVSFQNRGSNTLTGQFIIGEITFLSGPTGLEIETFAGSFEQHSEGAAPALFGTFIYDVHGTVIAEPGTLMLVAGGLLPLLSLARHKRRLLK